MASRKAGHHHLKVYNRVTKPVTGIHGNVLGMCSVFQTLFVIESLFFVMSNDDKMSLVRMNFAD